MKPFFIRLTAILALLALLSGCQSLPEKFATAVPLKAKETQSRLSALKAGLAASGSNIWRYSADIEVESQEGGHSLGAVCLWQPGERVRWRFRYMGYTLFSALGDKDNWLLFYENEAKVYVCPAYKLAALQSADIPQSVWQLLEKSRQGFLPESSAVIGYSLENCLLLEEENQDFKSYLSFDDAIPPLPLQAIFKGSKGHCQASFSRPEAFSSPKAFLPLTNDYKVIRL